GTGRTTRGSRTSRSRLPRGGPTVACYGGHRTLHRVPAGHTGGRPTLVLGPGQVEVEPARLGDQLCGGRTRSHVTGHRTVHDRAQRLVHPVHVDLTVADPKERSEERR